MVRAVEKQTDALRALTKTVEHREGIMDAVDRVAWRMVGPGLVRIIEGTRSMGTSDTEIVDELLRRIRDGWFE